MAHIKKLNFLKNHKDLVDENYGMVAVPTFSDFGTLPVEALTHGCHVTKNAFGAIRMTFLVLDSSVSADTSYLRGGINELAPPIILYTVRGGNL